jgi:hypothetical protein
MSTPTDNPVASFDIEAWRTGRKTPTRVVPITNDPGAGLRLITARRELEQIRSEVDDAKAEGRSVPGSRAGSRSTPQEQERADEIRALLAELDGTWSFVHIRALNPHEANAVGDVENRVDRVAVALASTDKDGKPAATISGSEDTPGITQTVEQWHDLLDAIGSTQMLKLEAALNELTSAAVTPDFSQRVSSLLNGRTSSSN